MINNQAKTNIVFLTCFVVAIGISVSFAQQMKEKITALRGKLKTTSKISSNLKRRLDDYDENLFKYRQKVEKLSIELENAKELTETQEEKVIRLEKIQSRLRDHRKLFKERIKNLKNENERIKTEYEQKQKELELAAPQQSQISELPMMIQADSIDADDETKKIAVDSAPTLELEEALQTKADELLTLKKEYLLYKKQNLNLQHQLDFSKAKLQEAHERRKTDILNERKQLIKAHTKEKEKLLKTQKTLKKEIKKLDKEFDASVKEMKLAIRDKEKAIIELAENNKAREGLEDDVANMHYNLGVIYTQRNDFKRAIREYKWALKLKPVDADAHYNIAIIYDEVKKDPEAAMAHYRAYLDLRPQAKDAQRVRKWIIDKGSEAKVQVR